MKYDFDKIIDRTGNNSAKYDELEKKFGVKEIIPLYVADMDFEVAQPIIDALTDKVQEKIFGYTSRPASYFEAICDWQLRHNGWQIDPRYMSHCQGVIPIISAIIHEFSKRNDSILIQTPVYPEFEDAVKIWKRKLLVNQLIEKDGYYSVDYADFEEKLKLGPKFFILCSPHNPVGRIWREDELRKMCELCIKYDVMIISDEIHSDLTLWGHKHIPVCTLSDAISKTTITCISGTKTFNLAGLQAGIAVFPNMKLKNVFDNFWSGLDVVRNNAFSVVAVETAFRKGDEWLTQLRTYLEQNITYIHDYCTKYIPEIKANLPEATYLVWLDCRNLGLDDDELMDFMIHKAGIALNSGKAFGNGGEGHMRLNAACSKIVLEQALKQLQTAVENMDITTNR